MNSGFFFNVTATSEIYTLSLHDALPIYAISHGEFDGIRVEMHRIITQVLDNINKSALHGFTIDETYRSEEHTSELQSQSNLVCRLLLEKKNVLVVHTLVISS